MTNDATVLFVDNFDSFTWNLVDYTSVEGVDTVVENNRVSLERVDEIAPDGIVVSPGPGHPCERTRHR